MTKGSIKISAYDHGNTFRFVVDVTELDHTTESGYAMHSYDIEAANKKTAKQTLEAVLKTELER